MGSNPKHTIYNFSALSLILYYFVIVLIKEHGRVWPNFFFVKNALKCHNICEHDWAGPDICVHQKKNISVQDQLELYAAEMFSKLPKLPNLSLRVI